MSYFFPSTTPRRRSPLDSFSDLPRPLSTGDIELSTEETQLPPPSMMYSMLPAMVQSHIPRLSSLRRSVSELRRRPSHARAASLDALGTQTPPPQYTSRPSSRGDILCTPLDVSDSEAYPEDGVMSSSTASPLLVGSDGESGINWKFSNQGLTLLKLAFQESSSITSDIDDGQPMFARQLYVHSLTYLLRGLPNDMTSEEKLSICTAMPFGTLDTSHTGPSDGTVGSRDPQGQPETEELEPETSIIHKALAYSIVQTFVMVHFLLPYVKLFVGHAYQYDRKHRITERVLSASLDTVDEVGKRTLKYTQAICAMNDGKVGQAIGDLTVWWVQSVAGGVHQGVSEGFVVLTAGEKAPSGPTTRQRRAQIKR